MDKGTKQGFLERRSTEVRHPGMGSRSREDGKRRDADGRKGEEAERASVAPVPENKKQKRIVKNTK